MKVLFVHHVLTYAQAAVIMKKLQQRKHRDQGYYFELLDLGATIKDTMPIQELYDRWYSRYARAAMQLPACELRVYRDAPDPK